MQAGQAAAVLKSDRNGTESIKRLGNFWLQSGRAGVSEPSNFS